MRYERLIENPNKITGLGGNVTTMGFQRSLNPC